VGTAGDETQSPALAASFPEGAALGELLLVRHLTVAVAESCTGGLLGAAITAIPGASGYFLGGVIAYSDQVKRDVLGVDGRTLSRHGAVSREVALAMASGAARRLGADLGLGITGVAGPGAEGTDKPVGLIHVAGWLRGRQSAVELRQQGDREANRAAAVRAALRLGADLAVD